MQHQPALYEAFMAPVYWTYRVLGAHTMDDVCASFFFTGWGHKYCPGGMWYCVGGNVLLGAYVALAALVATLAARLVPACRRRVRLPSKLKGE
jgi:hypothetical protein